VLTVTAEVLDQDDSTTSVKASGMVDGRTSLTARLKLHRFNLADSDPGKAYLDQMVRADLRRFWAILHPAPAAAGAAPVTRAG
jgi:hypothetical protein